MRVRGTAEESTLRDFCLGGFPRFRWDLLGFAFARAWLSYCLFFAQVEVADGVLGLSGDAVLLLSGSAIVLLFCFGRAAARHAFPRGPLPERSACLAALACGAVGAVLVWAGGALPIVWATACSLPFLGACAGLIQVTWCFRYAKLPLPSAAVYSLYSMLLAAMLAVLTNPYEVGVQASTFVFVPLFALVLLFVHVPGADRNDSPTGDEGAGAQGSDASSHVHPLESGGVTRFFGPVVAARFLYAVAYNFVLALLAGARGTSDAESYVSTSVAIVVVLAITLVKRERFDPAPFYRAVLPLSVTGFAVLYLLFDSGAGMAASMSFLGFGYKLFDLMYWLMVFKTIQMFPYRSGAVAVVGVCATYLGMGAGRAAAWRYALAYGSSGPDFGLCAIVCCCVLVIATAVVLPDRVVAHLWNLGGSTGRGRQKGANAAPQTGERGAVITDEAGAPPHGEPFEAALDRLASRCGLSVREREVLELLARGRSQPFIAQELCIARGTVHAHVARIYAKVGVNSQDALINAVQAEMGSTDGGSAD